VNKTGTAAFFGLWLGATGANTAGTEVISVAKPRLERLLLQLAFRVAGQLLLRLVRSIYMAPADFLVGGSGTATALTFEAEGEIGIV
jgi:hypothetical protein